MSAGRLLLAEVRAFSRAREPLILVVLYVAGGFVIARPEIVEAVRERFRASMDDGSSEEESDPACTSGEGRVRKVAVEGEVPVWFTWPDPLVDPEAADVVVRFAPSPPSEPGERWRGALQVEVLGQRPDAEVHAVADCVERLVAAESRSRLDALGLVAAPGRVAEVRRLDDPPEPSRTSPSPIGLGLLTTMALGAVTWAYEALPGARQRGWLETLGAAAVPGREVAAAYAGAAAIAALASAAAFQAGVLLAGGGIDPHWIWLPLAALTFAAVGVRAFITVPDMRASAFRSVWIPMVAMALGGVAMAVERAWGLGGLVPVGGLALSWLTEPTTASRVAAALLAVPTAWFAVRAAGTALDREGALGPAVGVTEARRAAGDFRPEALLLFVVAVTGMTFAGGAIGGSALAQLVLGQALFLALPALLAPVVLGQSVVDALRLRLPPASTWLRVPVVVAGTLAGGMLAARLQAYLLPENPFLLLRFGAAIEGLATGAGVLAVTLGAALSEELLFRGAIQGLLLRRGSAWKAVATQALAFALLHVLAFKILPTGVIGLVLGLFALRSGSLWPGVVAHTLHNGTLVLLAPSHPQVFDPDRWPAWGPWAAAGGLALGVMAAWTARPRPPTEPGNDPRR